MKTLCLLLAICSCTMVYAFSGQGAGTTKSPYLVSNAEELFEVRNNLSANYKQVADIDLTTFIQEETPRLGWLPIGSDSKAFKGVYDGNGKSIKGLYINRGSENCVGLFANAEDAQIYNVCLINPYIIGRSLVGAVAGTSGASIYKIVVMDGVIKGANCVGSICGRNTDNHDIYQCYSSAYVEITSNPTYYGGICGHNKGTIQSNRFDGEIKGNDQACCGITSSSATIYPYINHNIMSGKLIGKSTINGISYKAKSMQYNFMVADTLSGTDLYRISAYGYSNNYALNTTVLLSDGTEIQVDDNSRQGTSMGPKTLKKQSTYEGAGFNFKTVWKIKEGETYPYLQIQSDPVAVSSFTSGNHGTISGTAEGTGKVYVVIDSTLFETNVVDNKWSVALESIAQGCVAKVYFASDGKMPSMKVSATASATTGQESSVNQVTAPSISVQWAHPTCDIIGTTMGDYITIYSHSGQFICSAVAKAESVRLDASSWPAGTLLINIQSQGKQQTLKVIHPAD